MPETPRYTIRLPLYIREAIKAKVGERSASSWIIEAIQEKLQREDRKRPLSSKENP